MILAEKGVVGEAPDYDFGLYYPKEYVIRTWNAYRQHGLLPAVGALDDQDPLLIEHDWAVIGERYGYLLVTYEDWKDWRPARPAPSPDREPLSFAQLFKETL